MTLDDDSPSDDESFKSFSNDDDASSKEPSHAKQTSQAKAEDRPAKPVIERYPPDEESRLVAQSNEEKQTANTLFGKGSFENAIQTYDRALAACPNYLDYEIAVLRSNVSACHLKLQDWKAAVESASKGLECLDRLEPLPQPPRKAEKGGGDASARGPGDGASEMVEEVDDDLADRMENLRLSGRSIHEVRTLQTKLLLRRARARTALTGWADLQAADEDYRTLVTPVMQASLTNTDRRTVVEAQRALVPRLKEAQEKEVGEMMGKLKGLGDSILKPFGLSTNNFQFVKDENTGGYSMNFNQAGKS